MAENPLCAREIIIVLYNAPRRIGFWIVHHYSGSQPQLTVPLAKFLW